MALNIAQIYDRLRVDHKVQRLKNVSYPQYIVNFSDGSALTFGTYLKTEQSFCFVCTGDKTYSEASNANKAFVVGY